MTQLKLSAAFLVLAIPAGFVLAVLMNGGF
jgi:hypothetical protein